MLTTHVCMRVQPPVFGRAHTYLNFCHQTPSNRLMPRMCPVGLYDRYQYLSLPFAIPVGYKVSQGVGSPVLGVHSVLAQVLLWLNCFRFILQEART
jgi:hypothetical protein